jgi:nicotinamide-nucleotide amidase
MFAPDLLQQAEGLIRHYQAAGLRVAVAESCTGGLIAALLTEIPGSSAVLDRGFITYSNDAKHQILFVSPNDLALYGAVSAEVAAAMARGAIFQSDADISVSVTGIAGPGGGSDEKPVGLVYLGLMARGQAAQATRHIFTGTRSDIRQQAVRAALKLLTEATTHQAG